MDIASRLRQQNSDMRNRRLGLESKEKQRERNQKREAWDNRPRTFTPAPVTSVALALNQHAQNSAKSAAKIQKREKKIQAKKGKGVAAGSSGSTKRQKKLDALVKRQEQNTEKREKNSG